MFARAYLKEIFLFFFVSVSWTGFCERYGCRANRGNNISTFYFHRRRRLRCLSSFSSSSLRYFKPKKKCFLFSVAKSNIPCVGCSGPEKSSFQKFWSSLNLKEFFPFTEPRPESPRNAVIQPKLVIWNENRSFGLHPDVGESITSTCLIWNIFGMKIVILALAQTFRKQFRDVMLRCYCQRCLHIQIGIPCREVSHHLFPFESTNIAVIVRHSSNAAMPAGSITCGIRANSLFAAISIPNTHQIRMRNIFVNCEWKRINKLHICLTLCVSFDLHFEPYEHTQPKFCIRKTLMLHNHT